MGYLLDTNICIAILKDGDKRLIKKIKGMSPADFFLCSVVKAELFYGARNSQKVEDNLTLLKKFFSQFESYPFDDDAASYYGVTRAILTKAETPIGANDLIIAGICLNHDLVLVTRNKKEFERVPGLKVEVW
ncbi:MAG: type II toxin-antitoxin system VapC family toxin [Deltaproteobacteria bacterium]|nr:type II toxin-antitoxin system VapC family toxin [Deltaproteobacteria bacterium]